MHSFWDRLGIYTSMLCVVHCLATPALVLLMPVVGTLLSHAWFHAVIFVIVFPVAVWALWSGYREHHIARMLWIGGAGLVLLVVGMTFGNEQGSFEIVTMISAGVLLSLAHYLNLKACRHAHH